MTMKRYICTTNKVIAKMLKIYKHINIVEKLEKNRFFHDFNKVIYKAPENTPTDKYS